MHSPPGSHLVLYPTETKSNKGFWPAPLGSIGADRTDEPQVGEGVVMGAKDRGTSPKDKGKKPKRSLKEKRAAKKAKKGK